MKKVLKCVLAGGVLLTAVPAASQSFRSDFPEAYYLEPEFSTLRQFKMQQMELTDLLPFDLAAESFTACVDGLAAGYPCESVDLLSFMPLGDIGGGESNDIWGWTDPLTDKEYVILGRTDGSSFFDISDPTAPVFLGVLPSRTGPSTWRDIKVYGDHAFIVSEARDHGLQVFNLRQLRDVSSPPVTFVETAHYDGFGSAHNIVMNEDTGFAYAVGTRTCAGGLHMVNVQVPFVPVFAGCFADDDYTHDAQCVVYEGADNEHVGREICFAYNEDTLTVVDVTDKSAPDQLSRSGYPERGYTHQGWLTDDQRYLLLDDELDEGGLDVPTRTHIWDVSDLDAPVFLGIHEHSVAAIDHNLYIKGGYAYESNYRAGLRIMDLSCIADGLLHEVGFFDVYPDNNNRGYNGTWSNYPYFESGVIAVSGIEQGLYLVRANLPGPWLAQNPTSCSGDDVVLDGGPGDEYLWSTGETTRTITVAPATSTTYTVAVTLPAGCVVERREEVTVTAPVAAAGLDQEICAGTPTALGALPAEPGLLYTWTPAVGLSDPFAAQPLAAPETSTVYTLTVTHATAGCRASDEVEVTVGETTSLGLGNVLKAVKSGRNIVHHWTAPTGATGYALRRSPAKAAPATVESLPVTGGASGWIEVDALFDGLDHYDQVAAQRCDLGLMEPPAR